METKTIVAVAITAIVAFAAGMGTMLLQQPDTKTNTSVSHDMDSMNMSSDMAAMSGSLKDLKGDEFDKQFISEMITHHEGAVDMAKLALTNAKHQEIKSMAQDIIDAQTKEITQMKRWQAEWSY